MNQKEWKEREKMYGCWLCNFPGIRNGQMHKLVEICGGPEGIYFANQDIWGQVLEPKQIEGLKKHTESWRPKEQYMKMREQGIDFMIVSHEEYPQRLKNIPDAPFGLFFRGQLPKEDALSVAVVGARECSEYGKYVAKHLGETLGRYGVTVISGMAKGIDGISQEAALAAGGKSVGVLGCGVDVCYPAQNKKLYERLLEEGAIFSSYPIGTPAHSWNFPPRNRIVSGLADAVVVIEARMKSGTLITVDMALEQGREVYVVPGRVTDRLSDGCNRLLKQGAGVLLGPEEFIVELLEMRERKKGKIQADKPGSSRQEERCTGIDAKSETNENCQERGVGVSLRQGQISISRSENEKRTGQKNDKTKQGFSLTDISGSLPTELAQIYKLLDFYPKSTEEICRTLSSRYSEKQIITYLMQLGMENLAVQVSPGQFCRKGK